MKNDVDDLNFVVADVSFLYVENILSISQLQEWLTKNHI